MNVHLGFEEQSRLAGPLRECGSALMRGTTGRGFQFTNAPVPQQRSTLTSLANLARQVVNAAKVLADRYKVGVLPATPR
jgi:hypothetical protein